MDKKMDKQEILIRIDHTLLKPFASWEAIQELCMEAVRFHTASVCIPPCYVKKAREMFGEELTICTVIGFPLGNQTTKAKVEETKDALENGADEIDMVINLADVKNGEYEKVEQEIRIIKELTKKKILKVIIETCFLDEKEKVAMCKAVTGAGADYIKTSTGFGSGGALLEDIELFKKYIGPDVKIKAAGGIRTVEEMQKFIEVGCSRIGTSAAKLLMEDEII